MKTRDTAHPPAPDARRSSCAASFIGASFLVARRWRPLSWGMCLGMCWGCGDAGEAAPASTGGATSPSSGGAPGSGGLSPGGTVATHSGTGGYNGGTGGGGPDTGGSGGSGTGGIASGGAGTSGGPAVGAGTGGLASGGTGTGGSTAAGGAGGTSSGEIGTGGTGTGGTASPATEPVSVYIAGDSTVANYSDTPTPGEMAGWGQMLPERYNDLVTVHNHAIGGRTARRFIDEGRLQAIWDEIQAGDYLLVQFGTNDGHASATYTLNGQEIPYFLDPGTDFKRYLRNYVDGARERDAHIVLVTPPPRNSAYCTGGNGTGAHAQAMRELAEELDVPCADLNSRTVNYLQAICPAPIPEDFFFVRDDSSVDGTHFQENGARIMSGFVAEGIDEAGLGLAGYAQGE